MTCSNASLSGCTSFCIVATLVPRFLKGVLCTNWQKSVVDIVDFLDMLIIGDHSPKQHVRNGFGDSTVKQYPASSACTRMVLQ